MTLKLGVVFPQTEIGSEPSVLRDYVQTAEGLDYDYLLTFDHVLGANPDRAGGWDGPYTHKELFHEPLTLFSYFAALTEQIQLTTGILILPQRQTTLVAKQATQIDVLSNGRLRLGIGVGWNQVEYEALNKDFRTRGKRQAEQVEVLRALWTQELVEYHGQFHRISDAGLNPLPVQRPIPIWFGGQSDAVLRRMAKLGDGWIPNSFPIDKLSDMIDTLKDYLDEEGRDVSLFGIDYHILLENKTDSELVEEASALQELGVTHICLYTMGLGFAPTEHIATIERFKSLLG